MVTIRLAEDLETLLGAEVAAGRYASIEAAIDLALRRLLKPPPSPGPKTEEELLRYMYEVGEIAELPDSAGDLDDEDDEPIEIEGEPLSETILRERR